jgi:hypothetical protein
MQDWLVRFSRKAIDMRELTLLETGYLAAGLPLCLVLPLLMSFRGPQDAAARRSCLRVVWTGQAFLALAGLTVLASATLAPYAAAFAVVSCIGCVSSLLREIQSVRI